MSKTGWYGDSEMKSFALLWSSILTSSLWLLGTKDSKILFVAMLALKDRDGIVHNTVLGLADRAKLTPAECRAALEFLSSPDPDSDNKDEEGRRIVPVEDGWRIVSHEKYRSTGESTRAYWRESKAAQRKKSQNGPNFNTSSGPTATERAYVKALEDGDEQRADAILDDVNNARERKIEYKLKRQPKTK